jgi:hypothetical protein
MKLYRIIPGCLSAAIMLLSACSTTPIAIAPSNTPLQGVQVSENLGKTEGKDTAYSILGIFMIGRPDIETALSNAIKAKNGDALINVRCYESFSYFLFFSANTVRVEGEAVKFAPIAPEPQKGKTK